MTIRPHHLPVAAEQVGLVMVHGIGEQGRFEHLDVHIRGVINGLRRTGATVSVEIMSSPAAAFQSMQDSWVGAPQSPLRLLVRGVGAAVDIHVHEVWWGDVNERYSVAKQIRFWGWGLSLWARPWQGDTKLPTSDTKLPTSDVMFPPRTPVALGWRQSAGARARLYLVGCLFLMTSLTIGLALTLAKRLFNFEPPNIAKIFTNYLSSIKLYSQHHRGGSKLRGRGADFLDTIDNPPRVSVRRRMIRTLADVASQKYSRWYVVAHSQGSVVAFNGLMEPGFGWPGYLDEGRWQTLRDCAMAGEARGDYADLPAEADAVPPRPGWAGPRDIVYRSKIFARFRGLLTYGNPLEKFAAIWPGLVPVCRHKAFATDAQWFNVFDPLDPVSGVMQSWPTAAPKCCPPAQNIGFATSRILLLGHIKYLECPPGSEPPQAGQVTVADGVAQWLKTGAAGALVDATGKRFFKPKFRRKRARTVASWLEWGAAFVLATLLGALLLRPVLRVLAEAWRYIDEQVRPYAAGLYGLLPQAVQQVLSSVDDAPSKGFDGALTGAGQVHRWYWWLAWPPESSVFSWASILACSAWFVLAIAAATFAAGSIAFLFAPKPSRASLRDEAFSDLPSPDP